MLSSVAAIAASMPLACVPLHITNSTGSLLPAACDPRAPSLLNPQIDTSLRGARPAAVTVSCCFALGAVPRCSALGVRTLLLLALRWLLARLAALLPLGLALGGRLVLLLVLLLVTLLHAV